MNYSEAHKELNEILSLVLKKDLSKMDKPQKAKHEKQVEAIKKGCEALRKQSQTSLF